MRINGDNYSNFGEMVVKYGIPNKPNIQPSKNHKPVDLHYIPRDELSQHINDDVVIKYGIPNKPEFDVSQNSDNYLEYKPFVRFSHEILSQDDDEIVIKYGIPVPPDTNEAKANDDKNDVVLKYAIPLPPSQVSQEQKSFLRKFLDKLLKK